MNPQTKEIIEECAYQSHAGLLVFPEALRRLVEVGVESYFADYREQSTTYYLSNNGALRVDMEMPPIEMPSLFNQKDIVLAIRGAQTD